MIYEITEISTVSANGNLYVLVDFWQTQAALNSGAPPFYTEEFEMQFNLKPGDVVSDRIRANIEKHWANVVEYNWSGDHTRDASKQFFIDGAPVWQNSVSERPERGVDDPHGYLGRVDVSALRGARFEVVK